MRFNVNIRQWLCLFFYINSEIVHHYCSKKMAEINNKKEKSVKMEDIKHGSNAFPIASYRYNGNNYTKLLYAHWHTEVEVLCFEK